MFGGRGGGQRGRGGAGVQPRRGADIEASLTIDFADAVTGLETALYLTTEASAPLCWSAAARKLALPEGLWPLRRQRVTDDNQGMFSFSSPCQVCQGQRQCDRVPMRHLPRRRHRAAPTRSQDPSPGGREGRPDHPTQGPRSTGAQRWPDRRLARRADRDAPRPVWSLAAKTSPCQVPVSFADAALGADIDVPTLGGPSVTMRIKPGTQSGSAIG